MAGSRTFLVGAAVGSGIVARAAEEGGADFLIALSAGRLRNMGAASIACMLPITGANDLTWDFACTEVLPQSKLPVYLGLCSWGTSQPDDAIAEKVMATGFKGVANFPTSIHYSKGMSQVLDAAGYELRREIALLKAVKDAGGSTLFYCGTRVQAPMIDDLLKDIGIEGANVSKMGDVFRAAKDAQSLAKSTEPKKEDDDG